MKYLVGVGLICAVVSGVADDVSVGDEDVELDWVGV